MPAYKPYEAWGGSGWSQPTSQANPWATSGYSGGYYDPSSSYGATQDWSTSPIVSGPGGYYDLNPQAFYSRLIAPFASGVDPFSNFVRSQYTQFNQGLQAAQASNPNLNIQQYSTPFDEAWFRQRFMLQGPAVRGENNPLYGGGRLHWFMDAR